jgi:uncharacterized protein YecE (DUF72 family)
MALKIGTSGYSYDDWREVFYPQQIQKGKMLDYYAKHFDTVEINSTYYGIPKPIVCERWAEKTPENFEFIVKTHQETTHKRENNDAAMKDIINAIQPLADAKKFAGFLAQFPYSFKNTPGNRDYLKSTKELAGDYQLFVEFRNWTWNRAEIFEFLKENDIAYVNVDQPRLKGLLPPQGMATTNSAYLRFHGRNAKNWWEGTNVTRYDYLYNKEELNEWKIRISHLIKVSSKTYIFFNNHPHGQAVLNANMLRQMLES